MVTTHNYSTRVDSNTKEIVLQKDGRDVTCHKIPPMLGQDTLGRTVHFRVPCGTLCGRANIFTENGAKFYQQTCEAMCAEFALESVAEEETKKAGQIITLA